MSLPTSEARSADQNDRIGLEQQRAFYNQMWSTWEYQDSYAIHRLAALMTMISCVPVLKGSILDLGAGTGWIASILANFGRVTAVELSGDAVAAARAKYAGVEFISGDLYTTPLESNYYDLVISSEVIEHVPDANGYLDIVARVLKPGGYLALTTPNDYTRRHMSESEQRRFFPQILENTLSPRQLRELLRSRFEIIQYRTFAPGDGHLGVFRLFNSTKVCHLAAALRVRGMYDWLRCRLCLGLYQAVLARKPVSAGGIGPST